MFKIQFEQLEGYFRVHDKDNMFDSQSKFWDDNLKKEEFIKFLHMFFKF